MSNNNNTTTGWRRRRRRRRKSLSKATKMTVKEKKTKICEK